VTKKWYSFFVVTDDPATSPDEAAAETAQAPQRVADVVPDAEADAALAKTAKVHVDLNSVYEAAKIAAPAHGYTVLKVADMLQSEHIRTLPNDVKRKSLLVALDAAGVKVTDIVEDAVRRDRALDAYERVLQKSIEDLRAQTAAENQRLEEEIASRVAELRAKIDENSRKAKGEEDEFLAWQARKRQEEETIATAVSYFVSESPITTARPADTQGGADVR